MGELDPQEGPGPGEARGRDREAPPSQCPEPGAPGAAPKAGTEGPLPGSPARDGAGPGAGSRGGRSQGGFCGAGGRRSGAAAGARGSPEQVGGAGSGGPRGSGGQGWSGSGATGQSPPAGRDPRRGAGRGKVRGPQVPPIPLRWRKCLGSAPGGRWSVIRVERDVGCLLGALEMGVGHASEARPSRRSLHLGRVIPSIRLASCFLDPPPSLSLGRRDRDSQEKRDPASQEVEETFKKHLGPLLASSVKWESVRRPLLEEDLQ